LVHLQLAKVVLSYGGPLPITLGTAGTSSVVPSPLNQTVYFKIHVLDERLIINRWFFVTSPL